jgi:hypothetical protein
MSFQAFALGRQGLSDVLGSLPEEARRRTVSNGGRSHSIFSQALHETEHCKQIDAHCRYNNGF